MNNLEQFEKLLNTQGSNLEAWGEQDNLWAQELIANNNQARVAFEEQRALDDMLSNHVPHTMQHDLISSITAAVADNTKTTKPLAFPFWNTKSSDSFWQPVWRPIFTASLPLLLGILGGVYYPQESTTNAESIALLAFSDLGSEYQQEYQNEE